MRKLFAAATLSAAVLLAGCQNPDGSVNMGNTLLLGAGVAAVAGAAVLASNNGHHGYRGGYGGGYGYRPSYGYGYGRRGW
ncbi:hypothetical protein EOD42_06520 [Rhodovarius crocodyli]|uniref:Lipoprotein n=1 Tax=Rhodovarius crocodyli TaxID=1979269 RepID=A0A437MIJ4_9PROT|nr:hypothetical protein [Rhodovarius crocodyli]RVT97478.1 hypothetical protein EOD42_06520 [Rhodovarius crocodyli]